MAIWVTLTLIWAQVPDAAWEKWDWAFKTVAFATFLPFVIRSRVQIEAFAQTYVFSLAANFVPFGLKVLISGGGYGRDLGLVGGNSGLGGGGIALHLLPHGGSPGNLPRLAQPTDSKIQTDALGLLGDRRTGHRHRHRHV